MDINYRDGYSFPKSVLFWLYFSYNGKILNYEYQYSKSSEIS